MALTTTATNEHCVSQSHTRLVIIEGQNVKGDKITEASVQPNGRIRIVTPAHASKNLNLVFVGHLADSLGTGTYHVAGGMCAGKFVMRRR
jgi:hypothetical protein